MERRHFFRVMTGLASAVGAGSLFAKSAPVLPAPEIETPAIVPVVPEIPWFAPAGLNRGCGRGGQICLGIIAHPRPEGSPTVAFKYWARYSPFQKHTEELGGTLMLPMDVRYRAIYIKDLTNNVVLKERAGYDCHLVRLFPKGTEEWWWAPTFTSDDLINHRFRIYRPAQYSLDIVK